MPFSKVPYYSFGDALTRGVQNLDKQMKYGEAMRSAKAKQDFQNKKMKMEQQQSLVDRALELEKFDFEKQKHEQEMGMDKKKLQSLDDYRKGTLEGKYGQGGESGGLDSIVAKAFPGKSIGAATHRTVMKDLLMSGLTPFEAQKAAIDRVKERKTKTTRVTDELTGEVSFRESPGTPIFKERERGRTGEDRRGRKNPRYEGEDPIVYPRPRRTVKEAVPEATGIGTPFSNIRNVLSAVTAGVIPADEAYVRSRSTVESAKNMLRAFQESRYFNATEKRMIEQTVKGLESSMFKSPEEMLSQLESTDDFLKQKRDVAELEMRRSGILSPEERKKLASTITNIDELRAYLGMDAEPRTDGVSQSFSAPSRSYRGSGNVQDPELDEKIGNLLRELGLE